jgi:hypothetical protein
VVHLGADLVIATSTVYHQVYQGDPIVLAEGDVLVRISYTHPLPIGPRTILVRRTCGIMALSGLVLTRGE